MKVKVLKKFKDVHTKKIHEVNDVFEVSEKRLKEIQTVDSGLVEVIEEKKPQAKKKPAQK